MKITFTKLPTTEGTIKVSLDGGQSFTEHNIADVHESGISLSDDQDFEKIRIKGPANLLKNLDIVSSVKVEGASGASGESGGSVKLYAWNNPKDFNFFYQRVYTYSENPQVDDVVISGDNGDTQSIINIGKITSVEDGTFVVDLGLCCTKYNTRCPDDDIELTVNSSVDLSEYVEKKYFQGELYDGGCGYGYRITSYPEGFNSDNADILYNLYLEGGMTLGRLCEYDGHFDAFYGYEPPTGQLFIKLEYQDGCPGSYKYVPTRYFLKSTNNTSN